ncbi:MAG TPA: hypothetical protein VHK45_10165 [Geminicoccaceae bacterium]|nr:hypothetical protein [Geminicoccaceae bacterium]
MTASSTRGRQAIATALVAAPLLLLAANVVHPSHGLDAESWLSSAAAGQTRFYAGHVLFLAASAALILEVLGLVYTLRESRSALAWIGGGLTALGALGLTGLVSLDFVVWQIAGLPADRPEMIALLEKITASATIFDVLISAGLAGALAAVTIQPIAIAGSLAALVGFASVARSLLRVGASSSGTMSPSARLRVEPR